MESTFAPAHFIPAGLDMSTLPVELEAGLREIMQPAYRELVQNAADALDRSGGLTVVHLLWLELLQQCRMAGTVTDLSPNCDEVALHNSINRLLRLASAKERATAFLFKIRAFGRQLKNDRAPRRGRVTKQVRPRPSPNGRSNADRRR